MSSIPSHSPSLPAIRSTIDETDAAYPTETDDPAGGPMRMAGESLRGAEPHRMAAGKLAEHTAQRSWEPSDGPINVCGGDSAGTASLVGASSVAGAMTGMLIGVQGNTSKAFAMAVIERNEKVAQMFVDAGADVSAMVRDSARHERWGDVVFILKRGMMSANDIATILEESVRSNRATLTFHLSYYAEEQAKALCERFALNADVAGVKALLNTHVFPSTDVLLNIAKMPALYREKKIPAMRLLMKEMYVDDIDLALWRAVSSRNSLMITSMVAAGAPTLNALVKVAQLHDREMAQRLIRCGANVWEMLEAYGAGELGAVIAYPALKVGILEEPNLSDADRGWLLKDYLKLGDGVMMAAGELLRDEIRAGYHDAARWLRAAGVSADGSFSAGDAQGAGTREKNVAGMRTAGVDTVHTSSQRTGGDRNADAFGYAEKPRKQYV